MPLVLKKKEGETWLQAALKLATPYGLQQEVTNDYMLNIAQGQSEDTAAYNACYAWDVLEFYDGH